MRYHTLLSVLAAGVAAMSCGENRCCRVEDPSVDRILSDMRNDREWIAELDSLAEENIGPGARCLDAVKHTFEWDGRLWVYNQDWGGVLEIPCGYVPEDDPVQAELTYHGADILSPDSTVCISHYEGFRLVSADGFRQSCVDAFEDGGRFTSVSVSEGSVEFACGVQSPEVVIESMTEEGERGYYRFMLNSSDSVVYCISIHYPAGREGEMKDVMRMIGRYPFGPSGQGPRPDLL